MMGKTWYQVLGAMVRPAPIPLLPVPATQLPAVDLVKAVPTIGVAFVLSAHEPPAISSTLLGVPLSLLSVRPLR